MQLAFEGIANARELGGLLREDGYRIREDVLLRTGRLTDATRRDIKRLQDMGIYAIIDFRDDGVCRRDPDR